MKCSKEEHKPRITVMLAGIFLGGVCWILVIWILGEIGPQPVGYLRILSSPQDFGLPAWTDIAFDRIIDTAMLAFVFGGLLLGIAYPFRNKKLNNQALAAAIAQAVIHTIWIGALAVFSAIGFNISELIARLGTAVAMLLGLGILFIIYRIRRDLFF